MRELEFKSKPEKPEVVKPYIPMMGEEFEDEGIFDAPAPTRDSEWTDEPTDGAPW
jgi:hypothetical protein